MDFFQAFIALLYVAHIVVVPRWPEWYWVPFEAVWAVALTGIVLAVFGAFWWSLVALAGRTAFVVAWIGPAAFALVQVGARVGPFADEGLEPMGVNLISLAAWAAAAIVLALLLPRRR